MRRVSLIRNLGCMMSNHSGVTEIPAVITSNKFNLPQKLKGNDKSVGVEYVALAQKYKPINLGQGFPNFQAPLNIQGLTNVPINDNWSLNQYRMGNIVKGGRDWALKMLKSLPRVSLGNLKANPGINNKSKRGRGQYGGDKHGAGNKGSGQRQNYMQLGYETGNVPFHERFGFEPYYKGHHVRRQYPPLTLHYLQKMIDTNRIDSSKPIDLAALFNTGLIYINTRLKHAGIHLTDEGANIFQAKVNIEVQWASEPVIAAIEKNGGTITTAYYDIMSLQCLQDSEKFFKSGKPIPKRMLPPVDCLEYYSNPQTRGYLADPEKVSYERLILSQKYGYTLPKLEEDSNYENLIERKDPRQIFYGLEPGWVISMADKAILKPTAEYLEQYYGN